MDTLEHLVNRALSALGITIHGTASPLVKWINTWQFLANGLISPFVSPADAPSLAGATLIAPFPNTVPQVAGNLANDNGSVNTGILCARIYTLVATLPVNDGVTAPTFSWLAGPDFTKYEFPSSKYIALPNQSNQAAVGFVIVTNESAAVFVPGTTHLDASGINVEFIEYSVFLGTGSALANGDIWIGDVGGNAVARTLSGDATVSNTGVVTVTGATGDFSIGGILVGTPDTSVSGPGAVPVTSLNVELISTGTGDALTLANGTDGQIINLVYVDQGAGTDTMVLTPANALGFSTITFGTALGQSATLYFSGSAGAWCVLSVYGAVVA